MIEGQHLINGEWTEGEGAELQARNPWSLDPTWLGFEASEAQVDQAVMAARNALPDWSRTELEDRIATVRRFAELAKEHAEDLALSVARESGKPLWEARIEAGLIGAKVETSIAEHERQLSDRQVDMPGGRGVTRYHPHGVMAVLGPFNFPIHLPNGHIVPALLAGNTVVFKPSERTPSAGMLMVDLWQKAGLPAGVVSAVVGARETGQSLVGHEQVDGVLFTGSYRAGRAITASLVNEPGKIVALELGGNNPIVLHDIADLTAAAYTVLVSAFATAGQRCTCARRVILTESVDRDAFVRTLTEMAQSLRIGPYDADPAPFCGPVISPEAGQMMLDAQQQMLDAGGQSLLEMKAVGDHTGILSPGLVEIDPESLADEEHFGPLLALHTTDSFENAMTIANRTHYGLAASLLTDRSELFDAFVHTVRAGVINLNAPTVGASGKLPFGGTGRSGNHRPSGAAAATYCAYPVSSIENPVLNPIEKPLPGVELPA